jgi:hypothetical protein
LVRQALMSNEVLSQDNLNEEVKLIQLPRTPHPLRDGDCKRQDLQGNC